MFVSPSSGRGSGNDGRKSVAVLRVGTDVDENTRFGPDEHGGTGDGRLWAGVGDESCDDTFKNDKDSSCCADGLSCVEASWD